MSSVSPSEHVVLLTGGAGFIGSHTAHALGRAGYRVRILDCLDPQVHSDDGTFPTDLESRFECVHGDVRDDDVVRRALDGVSLVYHLASLTGVGQSMYDIRNYTDVNVSGTATLLDVIAKDRLPVHRLVLSSSRAVYGEGTHECPSCGIFYPGPRDRGDLEMGRFAIRCPDCGRAAIAKPTEEDRPLQPVSVYGWTKKCQEEQFQIASESFGLSVVILRYFNVYGSRQSLVNPYTGVVSIFFSRMMAGERISIYEGGVPVRDFVHVRDVVRANLRAGTMKVPSGTVLNVGSGQATTITGVAKVLGRAVGHDPDLEESGEFRVGDIVAAVADLGRAKEHLGFRPTVSLEEGMREFSAWAADQESSDAYERSVEELRFAGLFGRAGDTTPS